MAFSSTDLTTIEAAIASGSLRVRFGDGREVHYQTTADMLRARDAINEDILNNSAAPPSRMTRVIFNNGRSGY